MDFNFTKAYRKLFGISNGQPVKRNARVSVPMSEPVLSTTQVTSEELKRLVQAGMKGQEQRKEQEQTSIKKDECKADASPPDRRAEKEFLKTFKQLTHRHRAWDVWRDFVILSACAFSNAVDKQFYDEREKLYMRSIRKYNKEESCLFPELLTHMILALERNPEQDFLGTIYMDLHLGNSDGCQFFTPYHVCQLMADITLDGIMDVVRENGYCSISDTCSGAGATLIAGINETKKQLEKENLNYQNHVLVVAQEIDFVTGLMCYIQLSLLGVAGYVKIGNSLTDPMRENDDMKNYWFTPVYFSDVWSTRRCIRSMHELFQSEVK
ncbi:MAG: N-6 DNA methylase [Bacillota bacterium]